MARYQEPGRTRRRHFPEAQKDQMMGMIDKNPELFEKIALEVDAEVKKGTEKMMASMMVAKKYQKELQKLQ